jgi:hypothetical protein
MVADDLSAEICVFARESAQKKRPALLRNGALFALFKIYPQVIEIVVCSLSK